MVKYYSHDYFSFSFLSMLYWIQRQKLPDHASNHHMIFDLTNTRLVKTRFIIKATITNELVSCSSTLGFTNFWKLVFCFRKLFWLTVRKICPWDQEEPFEIFEITKSIYSNSERSQQFFRQIFIKYVTGILHHN